MGRSGRAPAVAPALVTLLLAGLALRVIIAYVLFPGSGFGSDLSSFTSWALTMAEVGPGAFYGSVSFADYPPGYLYVLWIVGLVAQALSPLAGGDTVGLATALIKVPPMLADLGVALLIHRLALLGLPNVRRRETLAVVAAALYLFNPVTAYDSALWGQTDAVGALVMLAAVAALIRGHSEGAAVLAVVAGLVKPQFGVVLAPLVGVVLLRRHLLLPGSGPRPSRIPGALRGWLIEEQGAWRLVSSATAALLALLLLITPFALDVPGFLELMARTAGGYEWLSVNAYNPWALIGADGRASLAAGGGWSPDTVPLLGPLTGVTIGSVVLAGGFLVGLARLAWREDRHSIILVAVFLSIVFFVLPTRVHERYVFPAFAFLPLLAIADRRWLWATVVLAAASFMNLHAILTDPLYGTPNVVALPLGELFRSYPLVALSALGHTAVFAFALWHLRPSGATSVAREEPPLVSMAGAPGPEAAGGAMPASARLTAARPPSLAAAYPVGLPAWEEEVQLSGFRVTTRPAQDAITAETEPAMAVGGATDQAAGSALDPPGGASPDTLGRSSGASSAGSSLVQRLVRLGPRAVRRDRSATLVGEPGGRFSRLDLLLVVLVVLSALTLRTWRLEEPRDMHFDEVYHARTATEFLQHWRYGMPHDIYEFTHPHLAKYAIAAGIVAFAGSPVSGTSELEVPVVDAGLEMRWSPEEAPGERNGDRLYVLTGTELRAYDLRDRALEARVPSSAATLAIDETGHLLYLVDEAGVVSSVDTTAFDAVRFDETSPTPDIQPVGTLEAPAARIVAADGGQVIVAIADEGGLVQAMEIATGEVTASVTIEGASAVVTVPEPRQVVADASLVEDPAAAAGLLAPALGEDAARLEELLRAVGPRVILASYVTDETRDAVQAVIDEGLVGVTVDNGPAVAAAGEAGVTVLDARSLEQLTNVALSGSPTGMTLVEGLDQPTLYVATGSQLETVTLPRDDAVRKGTVVSMPASITDVRWNPATNLVHARGQLPDAAPGAATPATATPDAAPGAAPPEAVQPAPDPSEGQTIYVVEPHANAVFADAPLSFAPQAWLLDAQPERPAADRQQILALGEEGQVAAVETGQYAFAWRMPGVLAGALMAALLFLLARILFKRRSVAVIVAVLALVDGMFFANARIAMNDAYVSVFIVAAFTLFAALYVGRWRGRLAVGLGLPAVGVLLGLALASKWVAAYAIGGVILLVLLRSALGRLMALSGMVLLTALLGYMAFLGSPEVDEPQRNPLFLVIMVALTVLMTVAFVLRPVRFTLEELRFAVIVPGVLGVLVAAGGLLLGSRLPSEGALSTSNVLLGGLLLLVLANVIYICAWMAGRQGIGPLAVASPAAESTSLVEPPAPPAEGWLRPGARFGIPWTWAMLCLTLVPLGVYIASYAPWVALGNRWLEGFPAGNTGQLFVDLQLSMYRYHDELRAAHAASSPWWAWPLSLKPVWFYQEGFANGTTALIYDAGNLVLFWLAIPAAGWAAWQAWRRRSLELTLVVIAAAALWLSWSRIDRATFQYHIFTSLPFFFLLLAYFLAELWHGPSARTWLVARVAAAVAILGVPLLWVGRSGLCALAGTARVAESSQACVEPPAQLVTLEQTALTVLVLMIGAGVLYWLWRGYLRHRGSAGMSAELTAGMSAELTAGRTAADGRWRLVAMGATVIGMTLLLALVRSGPAAAPPSDVLGGQAGFVIAGVLLVAVPPVLAALVLLARDSRRFMLGTLGAAALWFVLWYPNIAALPLPSGIAQMYLGVLPTYNYDFQFAVNLDPPFSSRLLSIDTLLLLAAVALLVIFTMYATYMWRLWLAADADDAAAGSPPSGLSPDQSPESA